MSADAKFRNPLRTAHARPAQISHPAQADAAQPSDSVRTLVALGVGANAVTQFALQAYMSYGFAHQVWRIPTPLCAAVIVALDLFVTMFMVFTYLLRSARLRTRMYAWGVLFFGVGAQLFAAELFAQHEKWTQPVEVFAAFPALFLALSLHGLIIWRQHTGAPIDAPERMLPAPAEETRNLATPAETASGRAPLTIRPPRPSRAPAAPPTPSGAGASDVRAKARQLVAEGRTCGDTASIVGRSRRWVEQQTKDIRDAASPSEPLQLQARAIAGQGADLPKGNVQPKPAIDLATQVPSQAVPGESAT
jgi:hypothetical protein